MRRPGADLHRSYYRTEGYVVVMKRSGFGGAVNAVIGVFSRGSSQIVTFLLTLVAARYLTPAQFGIFSLAAIATTLIRTLLYSGAFEHLLKAKNARDESTECLLVNIFVAVAASGIVIVGAVVARAIAGPSILTDLLLILLPSNLIAAITGWQESLLLRTSRIRIYYGATLFAEVVAMTVAVLLFNAGAGIWSLAGQIYTRNITILCLYFIIERPILSSKPSRAKTMEVLGWSLHRYGTLLLSFGSTYAADIFLGIFLSPAATGLYRASSRLVTAIADMIGQPTRLIAMTIFSARAARGVSSATVWPGIFAVSAIFGWSALAGLAAGASTFVPLILGAKWAAAVPIVAILCIARAFTVLDSITGAALVAADHARVLLYRQTIAGVTLLITLTIVAPFGVVAVAVATAVVALANSVLLLAFVLRRLDGSSDALRTQLPLIGLPLCATAAGAWTAQLLSQTLALPPIGKAVLVVIAGGVGWAFAVALLNRKARALYTALSTAQAG
jgi:O-antigen/teichoic acid export membrane protein